MDNNPFDSPETCEVVEPVNSSTKPKNGCFWLLQLLGVAIISSCISCGLMPTVYFLALLLISTVFPTSGFDNYGQFGLVLLLLIPWGATIGFLGIIAWRISLLSFLAYTSVVFFLAFISSTVLEIATDNIASFISFSLATLLCMLISVSSIHILKKSVSSSCKAITG